VLFSDQSKLGLSGVFERCARSTVVRSAQDVCDVASGSSGVPLADGPVLIITTSSFSFRLVTIFHLDDNDANRHYFVPDGSESSLQEGFAEVANLCCGAVNRAMSELFPHMAMSIPCGLSARCVEHLAQLKPEYTARFGITINDTVKVGVTLCMCCTAPVDIPLTLSNTTQQSSGELEMF
jgi:hypothetical protein